MTIPRRKIRLLTNSRAKTRRRCARLHLLKYGLGYESTTIHDPLIHGDSAHKALEAWWRSWQLGNHGTIPLQHALEALDQAVLGHEIDRFNAARLQAMIEGYHARWSPEMEAGDWEVIGVELEFLAPLIDPTAGAEGEPPGRRSRNWVQGGKLDVLARHLPTNRIILLEHKTSSEDVSVGSTYWRRLRMDGQPSTYIDGAAAMGHRVDECWYDVIRKPDQKPYRATPVEQRQYTKEKRDKKTGEIVEPSRLYANQREEDEPVHDYLDRCRAAIAETPAAFLLREPVPRLDRELDQHRAEIFDLAEQLDRERLRDFSPRNVDACFHFNRECEFWQVCSGAASLDDRRLYRIRSTVHPELSYPERPEQPTTATRELLAIANPQEDTSL